jgi:DNA-directed RNA polymerase
MSGRGRGRGGRGRFHRKSSTLLSLRSKNQESKKSIKDWNYYISSAKQASEYEATTEFLVNHIKETFEFGGDIAMAIVNQAPINTDFWKPRLQKILNKKNRE